ncbi:NAD-dependent epimerase/dehydratase family protein [Bosea psychrotolerans]|uniref:Nucleoside-diphosphate-sugar epimerase n=1 Tax=Bosea psychrotolerans TaxID=1871628 RepID=A0A2S4MBB6_9HYPH|nr:NAD-dependent epimerase/dehydratase family protein [Bosea psychrotolerans]POR51935.1 nucleoside-diphosphate-sugar epimerase [Bosea psychrotolerans]
MALTVFVAGATGVIGRSLLRLLRDAGHTVVGMTRTPERAAELEALGASAAIADAFDEVALEKAVAAAAPDVLVHQLTDLSTGAGAGVREEGVRRNARIRREGTANLVRAARISGVRRFVAQSIGWAYAPQTPPFLETDPLDVAATGTRAISVTGGVIPLESAVLDQDAFEGLVLRYGQLYGPGTWSAEPSGTAPLHVEAAAYAAFLAVDRGRSGVYNIAEPGGALVIDKALGELGWNPDFRLAGQT